MRDSEGRQNEVFGKSVNELDMSVRVANTLAKLGVGTIGDLVEQCTAHRLRNAVEDPAKADKVIQEVRDLLAEIGFTLRDE